MARGAAGSTGSCAGVGLSFTSDPKLQKLTRTLLYLQPRYVNCGQAVVLFDTSACLPRESEDGMNLVHDWSGDLMLPPVLFCTAGKAA
jgi:hypothetical protein